MKTLRARRCAAVLALLAPVFAAGCGQNEYHFVSMGTAPVGGTFPVMGNAMAEVLNEHPPNEGDWADWKVQTKGTKGTQENIRRLSHNEFELGLSNAAISYFAYRGEGGWEKPYEGVRAVATLAPLVGLFITRPDTGIKEVADLKGKRVVIGPAGAGFEMFVRPILEEHGVPWESITVLNDPQSIAVDRLGDGAADAIFLGGAANTRHPSITQAIGTFDVVFVKYNPEAQQRLTAKYPFYRIMKIPAVDEEGKPMYAGMTEDFSAMNVGNAQIIAYESTPKELIRQIVETLCTNQEEVIKKHPIGKALAPPIAPNYVGIPFHEGAIEFYRTWKGVRPNAWEPPSPGATTAGSPGGSPDKPAQTAQTSGHATSSSAIADAAEEIAPAVSPLE